MRQKHSGRPPINSETKKLVIRLYREDYLVKNIALACNISLSSVFNIVREYRMGVLDIDTAK